MTKKIKFNYKLTYNANNLINQFEATLTAAKNLSTKKNFTGNIDFISDYYNNKLEIYNNERFNQFLKVMFIKDKQVINILFANYIKQVKDNSIIDISVKASLTGKNLKTLKRLVTIFTDTSSYYEITKDTLEKWLDDNFKTELVKHVTLTIDNNFKIPLFIDTKSLISAELITENESGMVSTHTTANIESITDFITNNDTNTNIKVKTA